MLLAACEKSIRGRNAKNHPGHPRLGLQGDPIRARGTYILKASLITKDNAKDFYFKDSPF